MLSLDYDKFKEKTMKMEEKCKYFDECPTRGTLSNFIAHTIYGLGNLGLKETVFLKDFEREFCTSEEREHCVQYQELEKKLREEKH